MVNNAIQNTKVIKTILSDAEISALVKLTGVTLKKTSPLGQIKPAAASENIHNFKEAGLLDGNGRPTPECLESFRILAAPETEIDLLWGNPDGVSTSRVYSAQGKDKLVSYTRNGNNHHLSCFLSMDDITDLVIGKIALPEIKDPVDLNIENSSSIVPVFLALLDLHREAQLKAALERRTGTDTLVTIEEVTRLLEISKMETDLNWYAPGGFILLPDHIGVSKSINEGLDILKREGIIGPDNTLNTRMVAFASRAFPLVSFLSVRAVSLNGGYLEKAQFALMRGISTLLLVQLSPEGGANQALISSISTSRIPELLFNLATRPFEVTPSPEPAAPQAASAGSAPCAKCGTANDPGSKFCAKCGAPAAAPAKAKFCPKCGDPVTTGEKFCDKCGTKLV